MTDQKYQFNSWGHPTVRPPAHCVEFDDWGHPNRPVQDQRQHEIESKGDAQASANQRSEYAHLFSPHQNQTRPVMRSANPSTQPQPQHATVASYAHLFPAAKKSNSPPISFDNWGHPVQKPKGNAGLPAQVDSKSVPQDIESKMTQQELHSDPFRFSVLNAMNDGVDDDPLQFARKTVATDLAKSVGDKLKAEDIDKLDAVALGQLTAIKPESIKAKLDEGVSFDDLMKVLPDMIAKQKRDELGAPAADKTDIFNSPIDKPLDDKNPDGDKYTVSTYTNKLLIDKYRTGVEKGDYAKDSPQAKLVRAYDAKIAIHQGKEILPNYEGDGLFGGTYRSYRGGEDHPESELVTSADMKDILQEDKVNNQIGELFKDEAIAKDYQDCLNESLKSLPNKDELTDQLAKTVQNPEYTNALKDMAALGLGQQAQEMVTKDMTALSTLSPEKAKAAQQDVALNAMSTDFESLVDDPSKLDDATVAAATTDSVAVAIQMLRSGGSLARHSSQTLADVAKLEETMGNKTNVNNLSKVIRQQVIDGKLDGKALDAANKNMTPDEFKRAMDKAYIPAEQQGKLREFFLSAQRTGVWGSVTSVAALGSFAYKVSKGAFSKDSTPVERLSAARDIVSYMSVMTFNVKLSAKLHSMFSTPKEPTPKEIKAAGGDKAKAIAEQRKDIQDKSLAKMGYNQSLPEVWDEKSFLPAGKSWNELLTGQPAGTDQAIKDAKKPPPNALLTDIDGKHIIAGDTVMADGNKVLEESKKFPLPESLKAKVGVTALKTLGTVADFGGVIDIVLGSIGMKKALKANDQGQIVANSMTITGGVSLTGAAVLGTASLVAPIGAVAGALVAPLFWVGAAFAVGGFLAGTIATKVKRHKDLQKTTDQQSNEFKSWADDGLAQGDWENKVKYLQNAYAIYNNDNPDPSKSYFAAQSAEWDYFNKTPAKNGSDLNRINKDLHVNSALTNTNSYSEIFTGQYQKFTPDENEKIKQLNDKVNEAATQHNQKGFNNAVEERDKLTKQILSAHGESRDDDMRLAKEEDKQWNLATGEEDFPVVMGG